MSGLRQERMAALDFDRPCGAVRSDHCFDFHASLKLHTTGKAGVLRSDADYDLAVTFCFLREGDISLTRSSSYCHAVKQLLTSVVRENLHATFCGSRGAGDRPSATRWAPGKLVFLPRSTVVRSLSCERKSSGYFGVCGVLSRMKKAPNGRIFGLCRLNLNRSLPRLRRAHLTVESMQNFTRPELLKLGTAAVASLGTVAVCPSWFRPFQPVCTITRPGKPCTGT